MIMGGDLARRVLRVARWAAVPVAIALAAAIGGGGEVGAQTLAALDPTAVTPSVSGGAPGTLFNLTWTVANNGNGASLTHTDTVLLSTDTTVGNADDHALRHIGAPNTSPYTLTSNNFT